MRRVARTASCVFSWDPSFADALWIGRRVLPGAERRGRRRFPALADQAARRAAPRASTPSRSPRDCRDGFYGAYWRRPEAYLDPRGARRHLGAGQARDRTSSRRARRGCAEDLEPAPGPSATPTCSSATSSTSATGCWSAAKALLRPPLERAAARPPPARRAGGWSRRVVAARLAGRLARPAPPLVLDAQLGEGRVLGDDQVEHRAQVRLGALGLGQLAVHDRRRSPRARGPGRRSSRGRPSAASRRAAAASRPARPRGRRSSSSSRRRGRRSRSAARRCRARPSAPAPAP